MVSTGKQEAACMTMESLSTPSTDMLSSAGFSLTPLHRSIEVSRGPAAGSFQELVFSKLSHMTVKGDTVVTIETTPDCGSLMQVWRSCGSQPQWEDAVVFKQPITAVAASNEGDMVAVGAGSAYDLYIRDGGNGRLEKVASGELPAGATITALFFSETSVIVNGSDGSKQEVPSVQFAGR